MKMKRYRWMLALGTFMVLGVFTGARHYAAAMGQAVGAAMGAQEPEAVEATAVDRTFANNNHGVVFGTAAINPDGTIASCSFCVSGTTEHLSTGRYQVGFSFASVAANNGWSRSVQVDGFGYSNLVAPLVTCSTADRSGVATAVYVQCYNGTGTLTDTSFMLSVTR
jgi:hypothetical protein